MALGAPCLQNLSTPCQKQGAWDTEECEEKTVLAGAAVLKSMSSWLAAASSLLLLVLPAGFRNIPPSEGVVLLHPIKPLIFLWAERPGVSFPQRVRALACPQGGGPRRSSCQPPG